MRAKVSASWTVVGRAPAGIAEGGLMLLVECRGCLEVVDACWEVIVDSEAGLFVVSVGVARVTAVVEGMVAVAGGVGVMYVDGVAGALFDSSSGFAAGALLLSNSLNIATSWLWAASLSSSSCSL